MEKIDKLIIGGLVVAYFLIVALALSNIKVKATSSQLIKNRFKRGNLDTIFFDKSKEAPWNIYTPEQIENKECKPTIDPLMGWVIKN